MRVAAGAAHLLGKCAAARGAEYPTSGRRLPVGDAVTRAGRRSDRARQALRGRTAARPALVRAGGTPLAKPQLASPYDRGGVAPLDWGDEVGQRHVAPVTDLIGGGMARFEVGPRPGQVKVRGRDRVGGWVWGWGQWSGSGLVRPAVGDLESRLVSLFRLPPRPRALALPPSPPSLLGAICRAVREAAERRAATGVEVCDLRVEIAPVDGARAEGLLLEGRGGGAHEL